MADIKSLWRSTFDDGLAIYYNESFRNNLEMHIGFLRSRLNTITAQIPPEVALRNEFDFYGVLAELRIPKYMHWIVMRVNGYTTPTEFTVDRTTFILPDEGELDKLKSTFTAIHNIV